MIVRRWSDPTVISLDRNANLVVYNYRVMV